MTPCVAPKRQPSSAQPASSSSRTQGTLGVAGERQRRAVPGSGGGDQRAVTARARNGQASKTDVSRQTRSPSPVGDRDGKSTQLEAENAQLRAEVSQLRGELRGAVRELTARTEDLRDISSLLALRQQSSRQQSVVASTSNLGDGISDAHRSGQLSGICAEALVSRSSIIAGLEVENERYRAKVEEQDRMLLQLQAEMQAQTREVQSLFSQQFPHVVAEAEIAGRGRAIHTVMAASPVMAAPARGRGAGPLGAPPHNVGRRSNNSLDTLGAPPCLPSPRLAGRVLR